MATPAERVPSNNAPAPASQDADQHERDIENHEAFEYWGYLFQPDKTGTDKLKSLLRGLKDIIHESYEPSENPDLMPTQVASFYRDLHGNYDPLFLGTPSASLAFIYKSLGCLHSLQPLSHSTAFTEPTVPALKTEGWIMWETIQLLLGPEEHSSFLMEAVQKWDVKDPVTGETFPKILPRACFPSEPDKHMVAWHEGVSERLRREAEDEERQREIEADQAEVRRLKDRRRDDTDDEESIDSRGPALAYFRNPLYADVDGRPRIVRRSSKRPALSPRPTGVVGKGKEAATTMGHVIRNVASPHLWDGRHKSESRDRDRERRRRSSLPDNRYHHSGDPPPSAGHDSNLSPSYHRKRRSGQLEATSEDEEESPGNGEELRPRHSHHDDYDPTLRHSRSHEPTPSQKEYPDYFHGYDDPAFRRNSAFTGTPPSANGVGPSFGPSASPLFASHIAKQPQHNRPPPSREQHRPPPSRHLHRPYSHSPDPPHRPRDRDDRDPSLRPHDRDDRRYSSRDRHPRFEHSQSPGRRRAGSPDPRGPPPTSSMHQPGFPPVGAASGDSSRPVSAAPGSGYPSSGPLPSRDRRSSRVSGSDVSYSGPEDRDRDRRGSQKQTRFAQGVDGRRYPPEYPWR